MSAQRPFEETLVETMGWMTFWSALVFAGSVAVSRIMGKRKGIKADWRPMFIGAMWILAIWFKGFGFMGEQAGSTFHSLEQASFVGKGAQD